MSPNTHSIFTLTHENHLNPNATGEKCRALSDIHGEAMPLNHSRGSASDRLTLWEVVSSCPSFQWLCLLCFHGRREREKQGNRVD